VAFAIFWLCSNDCESSALFGFEFKARMPFPLPLVASDHCWAGRAVITSYFSTVGLGPCRLGYFKPLWVDFAFACPAALERNFLSNFGPTWADFAASASDFAAYAGGEQREDGRHPSLGANWGFGSCCLHGSFPGCCFTRRILFALELFERCIAKVRLRWALCTYTGSFCLAFWPAFGYFSPTWIDFA
jgi:hypothetical protein